MPCGCGAGGEGGTAGSGCCLFAGCGVPGADPPPPTHTTQSNTHACSKSGPRTPPPPATGLFPQVEAEQFVEQTLADGDIAVLDQNLDYGGDCNILGTDLVEDLMAKGFRGLVCIRSANISAQDKMKYFAAGAHIVCGKDMAMAQVVDDLKVAYVRQVLRNGGPHVQLVLPPMQRSHLSQVTMSSLGTL